MPSIHKQPGRPFWFCAYSTCDPLTQKTKRVFRSTKTKDKKQALEICRIWHKAAKFGRNGKLTPEAARDLIAAGVADVFAASNREALQSPTVRQWCNRWLDAKKIETESSTHDRYARIVERFLAVLGKAGGKDLAALRATEIADFRDHEAKALSRGTANLSLKVIRVCLGEAVRRGLLTTNPATGVPVLKKRGEGKRRAFTIAEIKRILAACSDDVEWRGLVLFGIYLGQRLGDLARLMWRSVNLETEEIAFSARKTGRRLVLPLMKPLIDYLTTLSASDDPDAFIFPNAAKATRTGTLSNRFRDILVAAGLVEPRTHEATGKSRDSARVSSEISFHSLRHSATTFLKAAGVSDALAREIIGHESAAISRGYTHLATADLRRAMKKLPTLR
jgi:integrase